MKDEAFQAQIAAARAYENLFVAGLFQEWAPRVIDFAQIQPGHRVLDVGCGTGILARETVQRIGPTGFVAGLDLNPGMLAVAEQLAPTLEWRQGKAESIPFPDQSFDRVVSQFSLMFFSDRHQAIREMLRVLKPHGRLAVAVWDSLANNPAYACEVGLLERVAGKSAADALRAPFVLGDRNPVVSLFEQAGTDSVTIMTQPGSARFPSIRTMVEADLRGWLPVMDVVLAEAQIQQILSEAEADLNPFIKVDRSIQFETSAHIVTGVKPH
ncbi:MAG: methyltransferase domain-containing protein [Leptolyngbyaceae cyanobacterium MO_188.B28]|nr:methyltransferase domain-containing protein [Leptolyngbyaceae cyanobacterium MO_188.B28]